MAYEVITKTYSGSNPYELDDTSTPAGVTSLYEALVAAGAMTYKDSAYVVHAKGDVTATVIYDVVGTQTLKVKEFKESRSLYGQTAFTFSAFGTYGIPTAGSSVNIMTEINEWFEDNETTGDSDFTLSDVHYRIDVTGQKRVLFIYDYSAAPSNTNYVAKLYEEKRYTVSSGGDPKTLLENDLAYIQNTDGTVLNGIWVGYEVDQSGNRSILVVYGVNNA